MTGVERDVAELPLRELQQRYLASCSASMPLGGLIAWAVLAMASYALGRHLPYYAPLIAAAAPLPLSLLLDRLRGSPGLQMAARLNPITQLFMRFMTVTGIVLPFVLLAGAAAHSMSLLMLGVGVVTGLVWVPHGWGAADPAAFAHFLLRAGLCYGAYLLAPPSIRETAIAGAVALSYLYAMIAMKKPRAASQTR